MIGKGVGFIGQLARLVLQDASPVEGAPTSIIANLPSLDPTSRTLGFTFGLYEREVRFYSGFSSGVGLSAPRCEDPGHKMFAFPFAFLRL